MRLHKLFIVLAGLPVLLALGCASPTTGPSRIMQRAMEPSEVPPPGQALVFIHRPHNQQGYRLYANIWDGHKFIADLGNGNSMGYVCAPGKHDFICRSVERVSVIDADLAPGKTYDLWVDICGAWIASFMVKPIKHDDPRRAQVANWTKNCLWVTTGPNQAEYERIKAPEIDLILHDFTAGDKQSRLEHLAADDCR